MQWLRLECRRRGFCTERVSTCRNGQHLPETLYPQLSLAAAHELRSRCRWVCAQREVETDAWQAALARAEGAKVYDDPKQLRRTIRMEAKAKEKRADAWKERTERQQQGMAAKQQKCARCHAAGVFPCRLSRAAAYTLCVVVHG